MWLAMAYARHRWRGKHDVSPGCLGFSEEKNLLTKRSCLCYNPLIQAMCNRENKSLKDLNFFWGGWVVKNISDQIYLELKKEDFFKPETIIQ